MSLISSLLMPACLLLEYFCVLHSISQCHCPQGNGALALGRLPLGLPHQCSSQNPVCYFQSYPAGLVLFGDCDQR